MSISTTPDAPADVKTDDWQLGDDNLARHALRALRAASITVARAERMTPEELAATPGLGRLRLQRVQQHLEHRRKAADVDQASRAQPVPQEPVDGRPSP